MASLTQEISFAKDGKVRVILEDENGAEKFYLISTWQELEEFTLAHLEEPLEFFDRLSEVFSVAQACHHIDPQFLTRNSENPDGSEEKQRQIGALIFEQLKQQMELEHKAPAQK